jgi:hypothetical protein
MQYKKQIKPPLCAAVSTASRRHGLEACTGLCGKYANMLKDDKRCTETIWTKLYYKSRNVYIFSTTFIVKKLRKYGEVEEFVVANFKCWSLQLTDCSFSLFTKLDTEFLFYFVLFTLPITYLLTYFIYFTYFTYLLTLLTYLITYLLTYLLIFVAICGKMKCCSELGICGWILEANKDRYFACGEMIGHVVMLIVVVLHHPAT